MQPFMYVYWNSDIQQIIKGLHLFTPILKWFTNELINRPNLFSYSCVMGGTFWKSNVVSFETIEEYANIFPQWWKGDHDLEISA